MFDMNFDSFSVPIPRIFYTKEGVPFSRCTICNSSLLEDDNSYVIERVFRDSKVVYEYAICSGCKESLDVEISVASMMNISKYMLSHIDIEEREMLLEDFDNDVRPWLAKCLMSGIPRSECSDYQIACECKGTSLIVSFMPFMVSQQSSMELNELLSKETKESFDKYVKEKLKPPANIKDLPVLP